MSMVPYSGIVPASRLREADDSQLIHLWLGTKISPNTRRAYRSEIERFQGFTNQPLAGITLGDLYAYGERLAGGALKPASQNRAITAIKSLLSFGHEAGYLAFNVGAAFKTKPNPDLLAQRILTEDEVARLIGEAPEGRDRVLLRLLYVSGARVSELAGLKWRDLSARPEGGQITVLGKGAKTRSILLKPGIWRELLDLRGSAGLEGPVFASRKGGGHLDASQLRRIVYAAARRADLGRKISPHWLRHAHASHALDRHAPIHLVQASLGHASVATTGRYLHARPAESSSLYLPD